MKKEIIEQLQSELSKAKDTIAKIEKQIESEIKKDERFWDINKICVDVNPLIVLDFITDMERLSIVADYCNELDEKQPLPFTKTFKKYYPAWSSQFESVIVDCNVLLLPMPYFHSSVTLNRLFKINPDFFESLLKPEENENI